MIREYWNSFVNFMPYPSRELRRFGALIMGSGMSLCMTELGIGLGSLAVIIGIAAGLIGIVMVSLAYPVYHRILKKEREKIADEILHLTDELMCL